MLVDGTASTVTDIHGHYRLNKLCARTYQLRIQYVGFVSLEREVSVKENTTLDFKLEADVGQLDEVVIRAHQAHTEHVHNATSLNAKQLTEGLTAAARKHGIQFCAQSVGGMFGLYFSKALPTSYAEVMGCDKEAFNRFFHAMLDAGHYLAPSAFEAGFVSAAHSEADIAATVAAADKIFAAWK